MDEFYQKMKVLLQESRAEIVKTFVANNESFKQIIESVDPKDFGDIASEDTDRKMLENMSEKDSKRLQMIDSALARLEQGKYGKYLKCGTKIPEARLTAIPYAAMCIECQSEIERRKR